MHRLWFVCGFLAVWLWGVIGFLPQRMVAGFSLLENWGFNTVFSSLYALGFPSLMSLVSSFGWVFSTVSTWFITKTTTFNKSINFNSLVGME